MADERIEAAAIRWKGLTFSRPRPARHGDVIKSPPAKPKKRWHEMPPSQRAALLTRDPEFWEYLETCEVSRPTTEMAADASLKHLCNVDSKSSILPGTTAHARFVDLEGDFMAWRQARQHGAA